MIVWRLARAPHTALDGEGGRLYASRWHSGGRPLFYAASHLSLAMIELLAHTDRDLVPHDLRALSISIPDTIRPESVSLTALGADWMAPENPACRAVGDAWLASGRSLMLAVPSAMVPDELNYLINPRHDAAPQMRIVDDRPFAFDPRLLGDAGR